MPADTTLCRRMMGATGTLRSTVPSVLLRGVTTQPRA
jgi:hypothetical protein